MNCPTFCCQCCNLKDKASDNYPHIVYKSPGNATEGERIPLEKIFGFPQEQTEYPIHPQITEDTITQQPAGTGETIDKMTSSHRYSYPLRPRRFDTMVSYYRPEQSVDVSTGDSNSSLLSYTALGTSVEPLVTLPSFPIIEQIETSTNDKNATLQFSVYYDIQSSVLKIHLMRATNLPTMCPSRAKREKQSVFVVMCLYPNKDELFESKPVPSENTCIFDESFRFHKLTVEEACRESIIFRIYRGTKPSRGRFVGSVVMSLGEADLFGVITTMKIDESGGNLPVSVEKGANVSGAI